MTRMSPRMMPCVFLPAMTSCSAIAGKRCQSGGSSNAMRTKMRTMKVVFPAPEPPMSAVKDPGSAYTLSPCRIMASRRH